MHRIAIIAGLALSSGALAQDCEGLFDTTIGTPGVAGGYVAKYVAWDDGNGEDLYACGSFTQAGGMAAGRVARWDGAAWSTLGSGASNNFANTLGTFDGKLYLGGFFSSVGGVGGTTNLAAWDGNEWSATGANLGNLDAVWSFGNFDDGNGEALYVGGSFTTIGGVSASRIARYDGETFEPLGSGVTRGVSTIVLDMQVWDDGSGPALFVCGRFGNAGGVPSALVAKWTGTEWESLDGGLGGTQAISLAVYDDGNGEKLYVAGGTITPPGQPATSVATWDGESWQSLGEPLGNNVWAVFPFDDGNGEALYAVGGYDDEDLDLFVKWDGAQWIDLGFAANGSIFCAEPWGDGVFIGGGFGQIDGRTAGGAVEFTVCDAGCPADCNGDGALNILDFVCFQGEWQNQTALGDCDANGQYNILDFVCYQGAFVAGCP